MNYESNLQCVWTTLISKTLDEIPPHSHRESPKADVKNSTEKQENGTHAQNSKAGIKAISPILLLSSQVEVELPVTGITGLDLRNFHINHLPSQPWREESL